MGFCEQTIVLSLVVGVILALVYTLFRKISLFVDKKILTFLLDFTFTAITCMLTFIVALVINHGIPRFFQIALHVIGFSCVLYLFYPLKSTRKLRINYKAKQKQKKT